jgi:hypothetical protein
MHMRAALLLLLLIPGCLRPGGTHGDKSHRRTAQLLAALMETAARSREAGLDAARSQAAADSTLKGQSSTREEFLAGVRALNLDLQEWREVSEEAARILEARLVSRGSAR